MKYANTALVVIVIVMGMLTAACTDAEIGLRTDDALVKHQISEANAAFLPRYSDLQTMYNLSHIKEVEGDAHIVLRVASGFKVTVAPSASLPDNLEGRALYLVRPSGADSDKQVVCVLADSGMAACTPVFDIASPGA